MNLFTFRAFSLFLITSILFIASARSQVGADNGISMIVFGATNYSDQEVPNNEVYDNPDFVRPTPGNSAKKYGNLVADFFDLVDLRKGNEKITLYVNDRDANAVTKAVDHIRKLGAKEKIENFEVVGVPGDFTKISLPPTTYARLDNPDEWYLYTHEGRVVASQADSIPVIAVLDRLGANSRTGLTITTYFYEAVDGLDYQVYPHFEFETVGRGLSYIWPDGRRDPRKALRYRLKRGSAGKSSLCQYILGGSEVANVPAGDAWLVKAQRKLNEMRELSTPNDSNTIDRH